MVITMQRASCDLRVAILERPGLRGQMSSGQFWFDSVINTTQYGGSSDEKILDLGPTVLAQQPFQSSGLGSRWFLGLS